MKFYRFLILIFFIGVEAKGKHHGVKEGSKGGKTQKRRGSRSLLGNESAAGRELLIDDINHGAVAQTPSKYGHLGLISEGGRFNPSGAAVGGPNGHQPAFSGVVQQLLPSSGLVNKTYGTVSKVKRSSSEVPVKSVEIRDQGSQREPPSFGSLLGQGAPYRAPPGLSNVQSQPSGVGQPGSNSGQGGNFANLYGQGSAQGQYPIHGQPIGNNQYGQGRMPAQQIVYGQAGNYYGSAVSQGDQFGQSGGQDQFGQAGSYYGPSLQEGQYPGQAANYYGSVPGTSTPGQGGPHGGYLPWGSLGSPAAPNQQAASPTQAGQNPCPPGFGSLPGDVQCFPYCANGETVGCLRPSPYQPYGLVPGPYGRMEKALPSDLYSAGPIHALSRYIAGGFYYPPPQHLNSNPNVWDPSARYYFSLDGGELPKGASQPLPNPPAPSANSFPITYSQI